MCGLAELGTAFTFAMLWRDKYPVPKTSVECYTLGGLLFLLGLGGWLFGGLAAFGPLMADPGPDAVPPPHGIYPIQILGAIILLLSTAAVVFGIRFLNKGNRRR